MFKHQYTNDTNYCMLKNILHKEVYGIYRGVAQVYHHHSIKKELTVEFNCLEKKY